VNGVVGQKQIGALLVEGGLIEPGQLRCALAEQRARGDRLVKTLMSLHYLTASDFQNFLAHMMRFGCIDLRNYSVRRDIVQLLPHDFAQQYDVIAIDRFRNHLSLGMACPLDEKTIERVEKMCGFRVNSFLCSFDDVELAIRKHYYSNTFSFDDLKTRFSTGDKYSERMAQLA